MGNVILGQYSEVLYDKLYPFQAQGVDFIINKKKCMLLDEQGCGKTIQTVRALSYLYNTGRIHKILIVCPAIMRITWLSELKDWWVMGAPKYADFPLTEVLTKNSDVISNDSKIVICSYEYVANNYSKYSKSAKSMRFMGFDAIVCDEAHKIKNVRTSRTKAIHNLMSEDVPVRLLLTGTPVTKDVDDLYSQLKLVMDAPAALLGKNIYAFREKFMNKHYGPFGVQWYGIKNKYMLKSYVDDCSLRRTKKEVLKDLPNLLHERIVVDVKESVAKESLKFVDIAMKTVLGYALPVNATEIDHIATMRKNLGLAKVKPTVEYIINYLSDFPNEKLVVFAYHNDVITSITKSLLFKNIAAAEITGSVPINVRNERIKSFQTEQTSPDQLPKPLQVLVINMLAGGVGITLTSAHTELFAELDWTPANISQAEARCHRIGQEQDVNVVFMLAKDSVDTHIFNTVLSKLTVIKEIVKE